MTRGERIGTRSAPSGSCAAQPRRPCGACAPLGGWLLFALLAGLSACERGLPPQGGGAAAQPVGRASTAPAPNILLISMDTTRADRLGCYGYAAGRTPHLDRLAAQGARFARCISSAPITLPAHATLLTATEPFVHGARDNGHFFVAPENTTLAEQLKVAGYRTGAQVGARVLRREYGLDQGFDSYGDNFRPARAAQSRGAFHNERPADAVTQAALDWLLGPATTASQRAPASQGAVAEPFFLFVHYFDPHAPYEAPPRWRDAAASPYDAEIAFVDEQIGRLLDALERAALVERTLVVVTADHGEGLGEHDEETHGYFLYDSTLHVPLLMRLPGVIAAGRRIETQVRLKDVAPTILELAGVPPLPAAQGVSLAPVVRGATAPADLPAYSETFYPYYSLGYAWSRAWSEAGWKYVHGVSPELFDLRTDPRELTNLAGVEPDRGAAARAALRTYIASAQPIVAAAEAHKSVGAAEQRSLAALGYLSGATEPDVVQGELDLFDPVGPEPRGHTAESRAMRQAVDQLAAGKLAESEATLRTLLRQSGRPETFAWAHETLATVLERQSRDADAVEHWQAVLRLRPDDGQVLARLADLFARLNRLAEARPLYERALACRPLFAETRHNYGRLLASQGELDAALAQQRAAIAEDPRFARAQTEIGLLLLKLGRPLEARAAFESALKIDEEQAEARGPLGQLLLAAREYDAAAEQFETLIAQQPDDARAHGGLGAARAAQGRTDEALRALQRATELDADLPQAWRALADLSVRARRYETAVSAFRRYARLRPADAGAALSLAWLLATCPVDSVRDGPEAVRIVQPLIPESGDVDPRVWDVLAAAQAEAGRFDEALASVQRAMQALEAQLASAPTAAAAALERLRREMEQRAALYQQGRPFRLSD